ncbi:MAG: hypothetical protein ABSH51_12790 [Solirubrobacteraceae bacterium]|jgi:hypothetical protein
MQPLAIDLQLLRSLLLPEMRIVPGRALMARVVNADGNGRGSISIAGYLLDAELPKHVGAGQELRLIVRETSAERVLLAISQPEQQTPAAAALPGGGTLTVTERDAEGGSSAEAHTLTLRYDAPALGAVDLRFELDPSSLRVGIAVSPAALASTQAGAGALGDALSAAVARAVSVTVSARREPLEIYA